MAKFQVGKLEGSEVEEFAPSPNVSLSPFPPRKQTGSTAKSDGGDVRDWIRPVTVLLALAAGSVLPALIKEWPHLIAALPSLALPSLQVGQEADGTFAFLAGLLLAGSAGLSVLVYIYWRFSRTLEHEKSVFLYPPVIPKGTTSLKI